MRRSLPLWSLGVVLLLSASHAGCTSWRVESVAPAELVARDHPSRIRVAGADGHHQVLRRPEVQGDSLQEGGPPRFSSPHRAVALADVTSVATSHFSLGKTMGLGLGVAAGAAAAALIVVAATWDGPFGGCCQ